MFENAHVTVAADILIFDPYKVTATGGIGAGCYSKEYLNKQLAIVTKQEKLVGQPRKISRAAAGSAQSALGSALAFIEPCCRSSKHIIPTGSATDAGAP
jgi:hypothetical protein